MHPTVPNMFSQVSSRGISLCSSTTMQLLQCFWKGIIKPGLNVFPQYTSTVGGSISHPARWHVVKSIVKSKTCLQDPKKNKNKTRTLPFVSLHGIFSSFSSFSSLPHLFLNTPTSPASSPDASHTCWCSSGCSCSSGPLRPPQAWARTCPAPSSTRNCPAPTP